MWKVIKVIIIFFFLSRRDAVYKRDEVAKLEIGKIYHLRNIKTPNSSGGGENFYLEYNFRD